MNLNAYDNITEKIDKTKTWIDVKKHLLLSREMKYHDYYVLTKRYEPSLKCYNYFVILLDNKPTDRIAYNTKKDDYGRIKIKLYDLYTESDLVYLEKDTNIKVTNVQHEEDGDAYLLDI